MNKHYIVLLFCWALGGLMNAQIKLSDDFEYEVGDPYRVIDASNKLYFHQGSSLLAIKIGREISIQKFADDKSN